MLHTLHQSPYQYDLTLLLRALTPEDGLLLLQDGVIAALEGCAALEKLCAAPINLYALKEDIEARGLSAQISTRIHQVDYTDFVRLTVAHPKMMAW